MLRRLSAVLIATLMLGVGPSSAFNVSGFEFHDVDRRLGERPADAGRTVDYESVVTSYNNARDAVINTQSSSSVMERLSRQLTAEARALLEQIPPERRTSYDQAMAAALESYTQMRATNQELVGRLARVSVELRALQSQILQTEGGELRLRSEIAALHETAEELHAEQRRIVAELPDVLACEEFARNLSLTLDRDLAAIRNEYWTEIGRYFKDRNFGTPVDYASPLQALPAQTERRAEVRDERYSTLTTPAAVLSSSSMVAAAVITDWGQAFPVAVATNPRSSDTRPGTEEEFSNRL
ncbi:MAG TPA: hypothetical protein VEU30_12345, partial [Thermoanaerobaculia bacterium]|nr:hypothetical protein [Thermoanaerobaculia bacterium]